VESSPAISSAETPAQRLPLASRHASGYQAATASRLSSCPNTTTARQTGRPVIQAHTAAPAEKPYCTVRLW